MQAALGSISLIGGDAGRKAQKKFKKSFTKSVIGGRY
jgi:hypothetical protein